MTPAPTAEPAGAPDRVVDGGSLGPLARSVRRSSPRSPSSPRPGRGGDKIPHPPADALDGIPAAQRRATPLALPELNEPEVIRHFVNLSHLNYSVDGGFYPLGSCTMKYNPKINEWAARLPGLRGAPSAGAGRHGPGQPAAAVRAAGHARRDRRHARGDAPAGRRRAGRADRDPADPGLPPCPRRHGARRGHRARLVARHQPGHGLDGRLPHGHRALALRMAAWTWRR